jgi:Ca2+-binding EF-hand superfamily protein
MNDIETLKDVFRNFDLDNTGKINGPKLYQAFKALNMQKRSPEVFDIVCKLANVDHDIDEEEFINIIGGTIGNCETEEGGDVVFERLCTRKFIWRDDEKREPIKEEDENEESVADSEEYDTVPLSESNRVEVGMFGRLADLYQFEVDENGDPMMSMDTLGVIFEDLNRMMGRNEIETIFFDASDRENYITKDAFRQMFKEKVLNVEGQSMNGSSKKIRRK